MQNKILATTFGFLLFSVINAGAVTVTVATLSSPIPVINSESGPFAIPGNVGTASATTTGSSAISGSPPTAPPWNGTALSNQPYFAAYNGNITITFTANQSNIQLLWGSIDANNTIEFFNSAISTTVPIFTLTGATLHDSYDTTISYGSVLGDGARKVDFAFGSSTFNFIEFISPDSTAALEFNFVGTAPSPVPIPGTVWLFGCALAGMAGLGKWRRSEITSLLSQQSDQNT